MAPERMNPGQTEGRAAKVVRAFELRRDGHGYRKIAEIMGISTTSAYEYVAEEMAALKALAQQKAEEYREMELARLDDAHEKLAASPKYQDGDPQAIAAAVRISESRRKLLGIDVEQAGKMPGNLTVTITGDDGGGKGGGDER